MTEPTGSEPSGTEPLKVDPPKVTSGTVAEEGITFRDKTRFQMLQTKDIVARLFVPKHWTVVVLINWTVMLLQLYFLWTGIWGSTGILLAALFWRAW